MVPVVASNFLSQIAGLDRQAPRYVNLRLTRTSVKATGLPQRPYHQSYGSRQIFRDGSFRGGMQAFGEVPDPAVERVLYDFTRGYGVFNTLDKYGNHLTIDAWILLLEKLGPLNDWKVVLDVFKWLQLRRWIKREGAVLYSKLIAIMGKQGQLRLASQIFREISSVFTDTPMYNSIIMAHLRCRNVERALETGLSYFEEMKKTTHALPSVTTYNILTRACGQAGLIDKAETLFIEMMRVGLKPNTYTFNGFLDAYGKLGCYKDMEFKLREMKEQSVQPDLITFNILIDAYGKAGDFVKMERVYKVLRNSLKFKPSVSTFNSMLASYGRFGKLRNMEQVLVIMDMAGLGPDLGTYNALIASYGKAGEFQMMQNCFNKMIDSPALKPQVSTMDAVLQAYVDHEKIEEAELLLINSHKINITPAVSSYLILFRAYGEDCQLDKMSELMRKMEENGVQSSEEFLLRALESYTGSEEKLPEAKRDAASVSQNFLVQNVSEHLQNTHMGEHVSDASNLQ